MQRRGGKKKNLFSRTKKKKEKEKERKKILNVEVFSEEILLYFPKAMGLVKDLVTCVEVNW